MFLQGRSQQLSQSFFFSPLTRRHTRERCIEGVRCSFLLFSGLLSRSCGSNPSSSSCVAEWIKKKRQMNVFTLGSMCDFPTAFKLWLNASLAFRSWQWWLNVDDGWSPVQRPLRDGTFHTDYCIRHVGGDKGPFQVSSPYVDAKIVCCESGTSILSFRWTFARFAVVPETLRIWKLWFWLPVCASWPDQTLLILFSLHLIRRGAIPAWIPYHLHLPPQKQLDTEWKVKTKKKKLKKERQPFGNTLPFCWHNWALSKALFLWVFCGLFLSN